MKMNVRAVCLAAAWALTALSPNTSVASAADQAASTLRNELTIATWKRVTDRSGSSLDVPISLVAEKRGEVGLKFQSDDGKVTIYFTTTTEPRPGFPGHDPKGDMDLKRSDCDSWPPQYMVLKNITAAYSCVKHHKVIYYIAKYNDSGDVALYVEYPVEARSLWDKLVGKMAASVRQVKRSIP